METGSSERGQAGETGALCGFSRCRKPLPPSGPRGGRPYEFCPDRQWPGNATCKQLAGAENALRTALGADPGQLALGGFATDVREHVDRALRPAAALQGVLTQVLARLDGEVAAVLAAVDGAERAAAADRGLREQAERRTVEAEHAAAQARDQAAEHEAARRDAEHARDEAIGRAKAAELKQARAESRRDAEHERAEQAEHRARDAAARHHTATEAAAQARQDAAAARTELAALDLRRADDRATADRDRDLAATELAAVRAEAATALTAARADADRAADQHRIELDRVRAAADTRLHTATREHRAALGELHERLGAARHHSATAEAAMADLRATAAADAAARAELAGTVDRVRTALSAPDPHAAVTAALNPVDWGL
ncbi:hypothetical protein [Actinokineospora sp.]|uniref:hypothetical protein n=1 Tax=Actinokineospora sp. TaxID=1872133 RepID=UPI004037BB42